VVDLADRLSFELWQGIRGCDLHRGLVACGCHGGSNTVTQGQGWAVGNGMASFVENGAKNRASGISSILSYAHSTVEELK
jgi:hypothetical protein